MEQRASILVRMPPALKAKVEQRTIAAKKTRGLNWSMNDEILSMLEAALKGRAER